MTEQKKERTFFRFSAAVILILAVAAAMYVINQIVKSGAPTKKTPVIGLVIQCGPQQVL